MSQVNIILCNSKENSVALNSPIKQIIAVLRNTLIASTIGLDNNSAYIFKSITKQQIYS